MNEMLVLILIIIFALVILFCINGYIVLSIVNLFLNTSISEYHPTNISHFKELRDNYKTIKQEYNDYIKQNKLSRFRDIDPNQINTDTTDIPWNILMLRVYNNDTDKVLYFPKTMGLINKIPHCTLAMFSVLTPHKKLENHYGPYKGILRYHLALTVPDNNQDCFLTVNGKNYNWEEGKDVLFDDTLLHSAENNTDQERVVLFLDIKKDFNNIFLDSINDYVLYFGKYNKTVTDIVTNTNKK